MEHDRIHRTANHAQHFSRISVPQRGQAAVGTAQESASIQRKQCRRPRPVARPSSRPQLTCRVNIPHGDQIALLPHGQTFPVGTELEPTNRKRVDKRLARFECDRVMKGHVGVGQRRYGHEPPVRAEAGWQDRARRQCRQFVDNASLLIVVQNPISIQPKHVHRSCGVHIKTIKLPAVVLNELVFRGTAFQIVDGNLITVIARFQTRLMGDDEFFAAREESYTRPGRNPGIPRPDDLAVFVAENRLLFNPGNIDFAIAVASCASQHVLTAEACRLRNGQRPGITPCGFG